MSNYYDYTPIINHIIQSFYALYANNSCYLHDNKYFKTKL